MCKILTPCNIKHCTQFWRVLCFQSHICFSNWASWVVFHLLTCNWNNTPSSPTRHLLQSVSSTVNCQYVLVKLKLEWLVDWVSWNMNDSDFTFFYKAFFLTTACCKKSSYREFVIEIHTLTNEIALWNSCKAAWLYCSCGFLQLFSFQIL